MAAPRSAATITVLLATIAAVGMSGSGSTAAEQPLATAVRITSPLGRTGVPGVIRIVAQVTTEAAGGVVPVRFFVDDVALGEDVDGPPYAIEWTDDNPYLKRVIRVEAPAREGGVASDTVSLPPLEVIEETSISSVLVEATVTDADGKYVSWLVKDDFTLNEDGVEQGLDMVQLQNVPTTFTLLVDASQSLNRRMGMVRAAARRLASSLRPGDRVIIAPFRTSVLSTTGPTDDRATIEEAIGAIRSTGGTAILDAMTTLPELFNAVEGRHVVILITDGYDEKSTATFDVAIRALQRLQATVYVVGIGGVAGISLKGETLLRRIAAQMGGRAFFPLREEQLPDVHATVAADAFRRYLISYTPKNQDADGAFRKIALTTVNPAYRIRTRDGYFAPKPPPVRPTIEFSAVSTTGGEPSLSAADLVVVEDGVPQSVDSFEEALAPISVAMVLDTSGSMRRAMATAQQAARSFVTALRPTDPLSLIRFSDSVVVEHEFSERRQTTLDAIDRLQATGGTALFDALHASIATLRRREGRRAIVLLSDGRDENNPGTAPGSQHTLDDVIEVLRESNTTIYAIGLGTNVDREALQTITTLSGGAVSFTEEPAALDAEFRRIVDDLRRRYLLAYTSTNSARDGAWRKVQVSTTVTGVTIRSAGGFQAPLAKK